MARAKKGGLGKGLDALFMDNETVDSGGVVTLRLSQIEPNRDQPRKIFSEEALNELADSIREHGVLQPLLVRPLPGGSYQLVAGERRWRASRMAGLQEVPVVIREMDEEQAMEIALIENLQREDLNAIEEATGYKQLMERYGTEEALLHDIAVGLKRHLDCEDWREGRGIPYAFRWLRDRRWNEKRKTAGRGEAAGPPEVSYGWR